MPNRFEPPSALQPSTFITTPATPFTSTPAAPSPSLTTVKATSPLTTSQAAPASPSNTVASSTTTNIEDQSSAPIQAQPSNPSDNSAEPQSATGQSSSDTIGSEPADASGQPPAGQTASAPQPVSVNALSVLSEAENSIAQAPSTQEQASNGDKPGSTDIVNAGTVHSPFSTDNVAVFSIGRSEIIAVQSASGIVVLDSTTLSVGGSAAVIAGQTVHLASTGIVVGSSNAIDFSSRPSETLAAQVPTPAEAVAVVTIGSSQFTAVQTVSGVAVLDGNTLSVSGSSAFIAGQTIAHAASGIVVDSSIAIAFSPSTTDFTTASSYPSSAESVAVLTIGGSTVSAIQLSFGVVAVGSMTLNAAASSAVIAGQIIHLGPLGIVVGSSTIPFSTITVASQASAQSQQTLTQALLPWGSATVTAIAAGPPGGVAIGRTTLTPGSPGITISGEIISLATDSEIVVAGTSTIRFSTVTATGLVGLAQTASGTETTVLVGGSSSSSTSGRGSMAPESVTATGHAVCVKPDLWMFFLGALCMALLV